MSLARKSFVAALLASAVLAPSALAKGGPGGGGAPPAPPTTFPPAVCFASSPAPNVFEIPLAAGNCLSLQEAANGDITLDGISAGPGYTFDVKKNAVNEVDVIFSNGNPLQTHEYRRSGTSVRVS
jgi:hypothetical protein